MNPLHLKPGGFGALCAPDFALAGSEFRVKNRPGIFHC
jgi:hypothetical protein